MDSAGNHETDCPKRQVMEAAATGWLCPACGRGNSPWNMTCPCVDQKIFYTYNGGDTEWAKVLS